MKKKSVVFVILAGILWGCISLFVSPLSRMVFDSREIVFTRLVFCALMLAVFLLFYDRSLFKIRLRDVWMFIGTGIVSLALFSFFYFSTMLLSETSVAVALLYTSPAFIMVFSAIIFREKITFKKVISIILTIIGCTLVSGLLSSSYKLSLSVMAMGIASGLFYALYSIFSRFALKRYKTLTINFYTFLFASFGCLFFVNPVTCAEKLVINPWGILLSALGALLCGVLPYLFYTMGLDGLDTSVAGVLVAVEPLIGSLIGFFVFKDSTDPLKIIGIVLILFSIVLVNIKFNKRSK